MFHESHVLVADILVPFMMIPVQYHHQGSVYDQIIN